MLQDNEKMKVQYLSNLLFVLFETLQAYRTQEKILAWFQISLLWQPKAKLLSVIEKQKVYCLSKSDVQKVVWNNTVWLLLQVVSSFEEKLVIYSSYCKKTTVCCSFFLHFSRSFIWAKLFFRPEFPFNALPVHTPVRTPVYRLSHSQSDQRILCVFQSVYNKYIYIYIAVVLVWCLGI